jgi:hypothetical protein
MGTSAVEVAATLRTTGVQGVRNTVRVLNPIVRYIQNELRLDNLDADVMACTNFRIHGPAGRQVPLPQTVLPFLDTFNRGSYPDLELPRS